MSNLRIIGLIIGLAGLIVTFLAYRGPRWKRRNFVFFSLFSIALIVVSANPASVNVLRDLLALEGSQRGRLLALLVFATLFLFVFTFYTKTRLETLRFQFDRLVRHLGAGAMDEAASLKDRMRPIMVLIPAYNEAPNLDLLLPAMPQRIRGTEAGVLVVDDGSEDGTAEVVVAHGQLVVRNPINRGGGAALRLGYDILRRAGVKICVTMDADGQHRPEEIDSVAGPVLEGKLDLVIGSRLLGGREKDNPLRLAGVHFFGRLVSLILGRRISDPSNGFRAFDMRIMEGVDLTEDQYHTSELLIGAVKRGYRVGEAPVTVLRRRHGRSKKGRDWKYAFHFARAIVRSWWQ